MEMFSIQFFYFGENNSTKLSSTEKMTLFCTYIRHYTYKNCTNFVHAMSPNIYKLIFQVITQLHLIVFSHSFLSLLFALLIWLPLNHIGFYSIRNANCLPTFFSLAPQCILISNARTSI